LRSVSQTVCLCGRKKESVWAEPVFGAEIVMFGSEDDLASENEVWEFRFGYLVSRTGEKVCPFSLLSVIDLV
jgi:hypothetical protein